MTNEQLKEIALRVALEVFDEHPHDDGHVVSNTGYNWIDDKVIEFATRILDALPKPEPVLEVVGMRNGSLSFTALSGLVLVPGTKLYTTPPDQSQRIAELETVVALKDEAITERTQRIVELEQEMAEQCRIIGMSGERELALTAKVAELERENEELRKDAEKWRAHEAKKADLINRGFLRSPLRDDAALAAKEKS